MKRALPIIVIVILLAVIFVPYLLQQAGGDQGSMGLDAVVEYVDGTKEIIETKGFGGLLPVTVYFPPETKALKSITFTLWCCFTYQGELQSVHTDATLSFDLGQDGTLERSVNPQYTYTDFGTGNILPMTTLASIKVDSGELETWAGASGDHVAEIRGRASATVIFSDGETEEMSTTEDVVGTFTFTVELMRATSPLEVRLDTGPVYLTPTG